MKISTLIIVVLSFFIAMVLNVLNYPTWMIYAKPDWVLLVLLYWCVVMPQRIGIASGFVVGLLTDVLYYSFLGQHALAKTVVAWFAVMAGSKLKFVPLWQQCLFVFFIAAIDIAIVVVVNLAINGVNIDFVYWQSAVVTCFVWAFVYMMLQYITRGILFN